MSAARAAKDAGGGGVDQATIDSWRNRDIENALGKAWAQQPDDYSWVNPKLRESAMIFPRFIASTLPIEKLYNRKATLQNIKLKESKYPGHVSIVLTQAGVYKVFENIHRYNDFLFEAAVGPGRSDLPAEYRPDMQIGRAHV